LIVIAVVLAAGCGLTEPVTIPVAPPIHCRGIPAQTCQQIVRDAHADAVD